MFTHPSQREFCHGQQNATPSGNAAFKKELLKYKVAKGSIQFPIDEPIPYGLVAKIAKFRVKETQVKKKAKR